MLTSGWRSVVMLFYSILMLTSLGVSTGIRILHCDPILPADEQRCPMDSSRRTFLSVTTTNAWRNQMLYAAAATAPRSSEDQADGRRSDTNNSSKTISIANDEHYGNSSSDYNIVSGTCGGTHGLEVQQDNTTEYLRGLPVYHVSVINTCLECSLADIHIACGDWASATEVNPQVFKRIADNDCVVNDGKPISSQGVIYFEYSNSFPYPMDVRHAFPSCS